MGTHSNQARVMTTGTLRIGAGAGFQGDRFEPAIILAEQGNLDYLVLECLAERTIALAQKNKLDNPTQGYDAFLRRRIEPLLPLIKRRGIRLITNMGAANPDAAGRAIIEIAKRQAISIRVAVVSGDDVLTSLAPELQIIESGLSLRTYANVISANAYLGVEAMLPALASGADLIITGRVADPSLFLAPMVHHFGWHVDDWQRLGQGTLVGHLLECAGQITGGYFADPGKKDVPDLAHLGFPLAEVREDGSAVLTKVAGTGGMINLSTVKEQLLYEVTDPSAYVTPDVVADFTQVKLEDLGNDRVYVSNGLGRARTDSYKVSIGYQAGFRGEGEISYAGQNALPRAELAARVLNERLREDFPDLHIDYIGSTSVHRKSFAPQANPYEIRLRVAALASSPKQAERIGEEVEALYTNGPAGGGAARKYVTEVIGIVSALLPRREVSSKLSVLESEPHRETV
ncbi:MAG: acyclic terpene utilization AtuA family protein [Burkholderiales bacterium]